MSSNLDVGPFGGGNTAIVQDQRAGGTDGLSITSTLADQTLNTIVRDRSWLVSLSSDEITLEAGEYDIYLEDICKSVNTTNNRITYTITDDLNNSLGRYITSNPVSRDQYMSVSNLIANTTLVAQGIIKLRCVALANVYRTSPSPIQGTEYYQKLIIKKVG